MRKNFTILFLTVSSLFYAQDTFSIVAVDPVTGEVGSAGASCVDLHGHFNDFPISFLSNHVPGKGVINTQASYDPINQQNALEKMKEGLSPSEIIDWVVNNDVNGLPEYRQYGIVDINNGVARVKAFTGKETLDYKGHIEGDTYTIQGNILLGQEVLDSMKSRFENEEGSLACKLMASLQGANIVGADSRCFANGTSSLFAFLKVSKPIDKEGSPSLLLEIKTRDNERLEPISIIQKQFNEANISCPSLLKTKDLASNSIVVYPNPANKFILINSVINIDEVKIYNVDGKLMKRSQIKNKTDKINVDDFNAGLYIIKVYKNNQIVQVTKFIKE